MYILQRQHGCTFKLLQPVFDHQ